MANRGTSVDGGWKLLSFGLCVFSGSFGVRKVSCYVSVQVRYLLDKCFFKMYSTPYHRQRLFGRGHIVRRMVAKELTGKVGVETTGAVVTTASSTEGKEKKEDFFPFDTRDLLGFK